MIEGHGDDLHHYGDKVIYNFSTNIVSRMDHAGLKRHLCGVLDKINSYPEPSPYSLEGLIADRLGIAADEVVVCNGATDAMYRIAHIHREGRSAILAPSFREYQDACRLHNHSVRFFETLAEIPEGMDLIWICNPNNPTGRIFGKESLLEVARRFRDATIVIDQAYADYTSLPVVSPQEAVETGNIILLSSLTKRFAVPGLRIGYLVTAPSLAEKIREAGMPWAVNTLAIEAGKYLLANIDSYPMEMESLHSEILRIGEGFSEMGIDCSATDCNFMLCRLPRGAAGALKEYLIENYGILIRDASNFERLDSRFFRVSALSPDANDILMEGVRRWLETI